MIRKSKVVNSVQKLVSQEETYSFHSKRALELSKTKDLHAVKLMRFLESLEREYLEKPIQLQFPEKSFVITHSYRQYDVHLIPLCRIRRVTYSHLVELIISTHLLLEYALTKLHFEQG